MSTGTRNLQRSPRRRHAARPSVVVGVGLVVLVLAGIVSYIATRAPDGVPLRDYKTLYASVPDPGNLQLHNEVRIAGVTVGQVLGIESADGRGVIELKLDPDVNPLPSDTKVLVRGKGLLGARYVQLVPGISRQELDWGSTIRGGANSLTYGVPDVIDTFDEQTRGALGEMSREFGRGLLTRGRELNDALAVAHQGSGGFTNLANEILERPGAARRLLPSVDQAATAFDASREDFTRMLSPLARGLEPFVEEREAVRDLIEEAPSTLGAVDSGLQEGRKLLGAARHLSVAVSDTLPAAPRGLRAARTLMRTSRVPLARTDDLLEALRPAVPDVLRVTGSLAPNLDPLKRAFDDLNHMATTLAPYACDIENAGDNMRSVIGYPQGPGGPMGPINGFRAVAAFGPEAAGSLATHPLIERGQKYEPYPPACKYSPGRNYDAYTGIREPAGYASSSREAGR